MGIRRMTTCHTFYLVSRILGNPYLQTTQYTPYFRAKHSGRDPDQKPKVYLYSS